MLLCVAQSAAVCCSGDQEEEARQTYVCVAACSVVLRSVLQCVAVCCSVLQCVAVCCSGYEEEEARYIITSLSGNSKKKKGSKRSFVMTHNRF